MVQRFKAIFPNRKLYLKRFFICTNIIRSKIQNISLSSVHLRIIIRYSILPLLQTNSANLLFWGKKVDFVHEIWCKSEHHGKVSFK